MSDDLTCREDIPLSLFDDVENAKVPEKRTSNPGNPILLTSTTTPTSSGTPNVIRFQPDSRITYSRNNDNTFTTYRKPPFSHMTRHGVIPPVVMPRTIPRDSGSENGLELRPSQIQQSNSSFSTTIKPLGNNAAPFFPPKREFDSRQVLNRSVSGGMTIQNPLQSPGQHVTTVIQPTSKIYKTISDGQGRMITRVNVPKISRITQLNTNPQVTRTVIPIRQTTSGQISRPNILRATKIQATAARNLQQRTPSISEQKPTTTDSKLIDNGLIKSTDQKSDAKVETKTVLHVTDIRNGAPQVITPQSTVIISCGLPGTQSSQQSSTTPIVRKRGRKQEILKDDSCHIGPPVTNIVVANPIIVKPVFNDGQQPNEGEPKTRRRGGGRKKKIDSENLVVKEPPKKRGRKNEANCVDKVNESETVPITVQINNQIDDSNKKVDISKDDLIQESIDALFSSPVQPFLGKLNTTSSGQASNEIGKKGRTAKTPRVPKQPKTPRVPRESKKDKEQNENKDVKSIKTTRSRKLPNEKQVTPQTQVILVTTNEKKIITPKVPLNTSLLGKTTQVKSDNKSKDLEIVKNKVVINKCDGKKRLPQTNLQNNSNNQSSKTTSLKDLRVMQLLKDHKASELTKNLTKEDTNKNEKKINKKIVRGILNNSKVADIIDDNKDVKNDNIIVKGKNDDETLDKLSDDKKSTTNLNNCGRNVQFKNESIVYNLSEKPREILKKSNLPLHGILKNKSVVSSITQTIPQIKNVSLNNSNNVKIRSIIPEPAIPGPSNVKIIPPPLINNNTKVITTSQNIKSKEIDKNVSNKTVVEKSSIPIKPPPTVSGPPGISKNTTSIPSETQQKNPPLADINNYAITSKDVIEHLLKEISKKSVSEKLEYVRIFSIYNKMTDVEKTAVHALCDMSKGLGKPVNNDPSYIEMMKKKCEEKLKEIAQIERDDMSTLQKNLLQKLKYQKFLNQSKRKSKKVNDIDKSKINNHTKASRKNKQEDVKKLKEKEKKLRDIVMYTDSKNEICEKILNETFNMVMNGKKSTFIGGFSVSKHCKVKADQKIKPKLSKSFIIKRNIMRSRREYKKLVLKKEQEAFFSEANNSIQTTQNNSLFRHKRLCMKYNDCYATKPYSVAEAKFIKKYNLSETFRYIDCNQVKRLMFDFFRKIDSPLKYTKRAFFYQLLKNKKVFGETKAAKEKLKMLIEHINKKLIKTKQKPFSLLSRCEILRTTPGILKSIFKPFKIFSKEKRKKMKCPGISNYLLNSKIIHGMAWEHIGSLHPERKQGLVDDINRLKKIMPVDQHLINLYEEHVLVGFEKYKPVPSTFYKAVYPILHPEVTKLFTLVDEDIDPNITKVYKNGRCYNVPGDDFYYSHGSIKQRETPQYPQLNEFASPTLGIKLDEDFEKLQGKIQNILKNDDVERINKLSDEEVLKTYELNKRSFEGTWLHNSWGTLAHWGEVVAGACVKADVAEAEALKTWLNAYVKYLTFRNDVYSTGRRTFPQLQLQRIGGDAPEDSILEFAECHQINYGSFGPEWKCKDNHKKDLEVSSFIVSCEGYDNENDQYILDGSCVLKYELDKRTIMDENENDAFYFWIFMLFVVGCIILTIFFRKHSNREIRNSETSNLSSGYLNRMDEYFGGRPYTDLSYQQRLINNHYSNDYIGSANMEWPCVGQSSNR
ncbi:Store-operated calcium entry-associated regulatory factor [Strongyloides ratti]|uniref:Store-operated calcium entry-associated regulatory factor n=1 Tax=Strongyloides ratti TaxID=34506 RepID=A0A090LT94_STRRB|nr:Store-operated calcium entry-associated regulatory factor [Strongyloides ratti]CEF70829.1 Store-operated calcium entry-associated regulatory factor [Strongyloides ratti]